MMVRFSVLYWILFTVIGVARWTGLEPATPAVTGRYSNQLNYHRTDKKMVVASGLEPLASTL